MASRDILRTFKDMTEKKYEIIQVAENDITRMLRGVNTTIPAEANMTLQTPITVEELKTAVKQGKKQKAPCLDGICQEFFQSTWNAVQDDLLSIMNHMYMEEIKSPSQRHGILIYIPKTQRPATPKDYRPPTLMNTDMKLLSRIITNRTRPWMNVILHSSQHCGVQGNNMYVVATIRDIIAEAELTQTPTCILSLDLQRLSTKLPMTICTLCWKPMVLADGSRNACASCTRTRRHLCK
jgi:hypothetical protein